MPDPLNILLISAHAAVCVLKGFAREEQKQLNVQNNKPSRNNPRCIGGQLATLVDNW